MAGAKILIVEDEGIEALDVQQRLIGLGFSVLEIASSGEEAVRKAEETAPDLVLMDIMLPGEVDGVTAAQEIRTRFDIPVIYLTAYADDSTLERARITEPYGYIVKPFQERELHITVEIALYKHAMERRLRESQRWFSTTLKSIGDAVIATDDRGHVTFMNAMAEKLTGWSLEDAANRPLTEVFAIINSDTRRSAENPVAKVIRKGGVVGLANHTVLVARDGTETPIDDSAAPIKDDKGRTIGIVLVFRDISDHQKAEADLRSREKELRLVLDAGPTLVSYVDADCRYRRVSKAYEQWIGCSAADCEGRHVREVMGEMAWAAVRPHVEKALAGETTSYEQKVPLPSGSELWLRSTYTPDRDESGRVRGFVVHAADVGEIKRAEEDLRRANDVLEQRVADRTAQLAKASEIVKAERRRLYDVMETLPAHVILLTPDYRVSFANRFFVEHFGEPEGRRCFEHLFHRGEPCENCETFAIFKTGTPHQWEWTGPDGRDYDMHDLPFTDADGAPLILEMGIDITERKRAEEALRMRSEQLRALASELTMAEQRERQRLAQILHDGLQQTLVAASFHLRVAEMSMDKAAGAEAAQVADLIRESIEQSRLLTAELSPPILREGGLVPALEWLSRLMHDHQGLTVALTAHGRVGPLAQDMTVLVFQAARELLFNVVKHAGVRAARLDVTQRGGELRLSVEDEGAGFDPARLRAAGGSVGGFGLFSIRERLELLSGKMEIKSSPGRGSRVLLSVPVDAALGRPASPVGEQPRVSVAVTPPARARSRNGSARIRVVLADDHMVMRQGLAALLRNEAGIEIVGEASDGDSAVKLVSEVRPDVVLMDINMPGMSGIEATRRIHARTPGVRVIGLSMFDEPQQAKAMREAGAVEFLTKSGPSEAIVEAMRACAGAFGTKRKVGRPRRSSQKAAGDDAGQTQ